MNEAIQNASSRTRQARSPIDRRTGERRAVTGAFATERRLTERRVVVDRRRVPERLKDLASILMGRLLHPRRHSV